MGQPQSLVLITVDCLRADHVGFLGHDRPTTPFLDSLAAESLVFRNAIVAGTPTYHSFPAIMASRYPLVMGRDVAGLAPEEPTIATALSQQGYATAGFVAANPYISRHFGYASGFETYLDFMNPKDAPAPSNGNGTISNRHRSNRALAAMFHKAGPLGPIYDELYFQYCQRIASRQPDSLDRLRRFPAADALVDHASDWLSTVSGRPFFLWLHFMDPHAPYYPLRQGLDDMGHAGMDASRVRYLNSYWNRSDLNPSRFEPYRDEVLALYESGIRSVDSQVSRLVDTLRSLRLWEDCMVAFTADHGEEFLDHGGRYHYPAKVTEEIIHVPLLLHASGDRRPAVTEVPFSLLDLAPTLLQAVGSPVPQSFRGRSRWQQLQNGQGGEENPVITECIDGSPFQWSKGPGGRILSVRQGRYKLVLDFKSPHEQLFDLQADPGEESPLPVATEPAVRRQLLQCARQHITNSLQWSDPAVRLVLSSRNLLWDLPGKDAVPLG